jgi:hypothetical protein
MILDSDCMDSRTPAALACFNLDALIGLSEDKARDEVTRLGGIVETVVLSAEGHIVTAGNYNPRRVSVLVDVDHRVVRVIRLG